ncbi:MAG: universal stress protein [Rhizobiales bacterium]|nr:universal stress protein [Hyphomicrobiales bacterium]
MGKKRRSTEEGHRRKFLVVIDDTPECTRALLYAARRAERTKGGLVLLYVIVPSEFTQWVGVENIMRAEAMEEAESSLGRFADMVRTWSSIEPQQVIREGVRADEIVKLIEEDEDIAVLVLAAGADKEGPGPLVTALAGKASGTFPVPITIVPGSLDEESISALA